MYSGFCRWMSWYRTHLLDPLSLTVMAWWWNETELMQFVTRMLAREQTCHRHLEESCWYWIHEIWYFTNWIGQTTLYLSFICLEVSISRMITLCKDLIFRAPSCANITLISTLNREQSSPRSFPPRGKTRYLRLSDRWCCSLRSSRMLLRVD
jgi:hypothetical protein